MLELSGIGPPTLGPAIGQECRHTSGRTKRERGHWCTYWGEQVSTAMQWSKLLTPYYSLARSFSQPDQGHKDSLTIPSRHYRMLMHKPTIYVLFGRVLNREWVSIPTPPQPTLWQSTLCIWYGHLIYIAWHNNCVCKSIMDDKDSTNVASL